MYALYELHFTPPGVAHSPAEQEATIIGLVLIPHHATRRRPFPRRIGGSKYGTRINFALGHQVARHPSPTFDGVNLSKCRPRYAVM